jgi:hypothetical protein
LEIKFKVRWRTMVERMLVAKLTGAPTRGLRRRRMVEASEAKPNPALAVGHFPLDLERGEEMALSHVCRQRQVPEVQPGDLDLVPSPAIQIELGVGEQSGAECLLQVRQLDSRCLPERPPHVEDAGDARRACPRLCEGERLRARPAHRHAMDRVPELDRRPTGAVCDLLAFAV